MKYGRESHGARDGVKGRFVVLPAILLPLITAAEESKYPNALFPASDIVARGSFYDVKRRIADGPPSGVVPIRFKVDEVIGQDAQDVVLTILVPTEVIEKTELMDRMHSTAKQDKKPGERDAARLIELGDIPHIVTGREYVLFLMRTDDHGVFSLGHRRTEWRVRIRDAGGIALDSVKRQFQQQASRSSRGWSSAEDQRRKIIKDTEGGERTNLDAK